MGWLELLRRQTQSELRDLSNVADAEKRAGQMLNLVGDERAKAAEKRLVRDKEAEKKIEKQLVQEFLRKEPALKDKDKVLAGELRELVMAIAKKLEGVYMGIGEIQEALMANPPNHEQAGQARQNVKQLLNSIEKDVNNAEKIARYMSLLEPIKNISCTAEFRALLRTQFRNELDYIQDRLVLLSDPGWMWANSKKLKEYDYYSTPHDQRNLGLRIIFEITGDRIIVCDILPHDDYIRQFTTKKTYKIFHGPIRPVTIPLRLFAALPSAQ